MSEKEIQEDIHTLMLTNVSSGYSKLLKKDYCYIKPSPDGTYPFQYFWDTCFHVFILCCLKEYELAKRNMESLFAAQEGNGFIGHMIFWNQLLPARWSDVLQARPTLKTIRPHMSALIQPPFAAQALFRIYEDTKDDAFLKKMLPKLKKYHAWLRLERDYEKNGLLSTITTFESGMDWKVSYDEIVGFKTKQANRELFLRVISVDARNFLHRYDLKKIYEKDYFIVKDVGVNTIYARDLQSMATLCHAIDDPDETLYTKQAKQSSESILKVMFDNEDDAFYDVYGKDNKKLKTLTPTIFFPMVLDEVSKEVCDDIFKKHFFNNKEFNLSYPIPSVSYDNPAFYPSDSLYLWRGPTWVVFNWFLYQCLLKKGYKDEAEKIFQTVKTLIEKSGFREYYNPLTGEGGGAKNFTWSGLILDMMRMREQNQTPGK